MREREKMKKQLNVDKETERKRERERIIWSKKQHNQHGLKSRSLSVI